MSIATPDRRPPPELMAHFASFDSAWGRRRLRLYLAWKRVTWRWVVGGAHLMKRGLDLIGSCVALFLFSPVYLGVAILIRLEDGGPIFFPQIRVGRHGREFRMF